MRPSPDLQTRSSSGLRLFAAAALAAAGVAFLSGSATVRNAPPPGFTALFNGRDLTGWWGATTEDPRTWQALAPETFAKKRTASLTDIAAHWRVENGELINDGKGLYLTSDRQFRDYELRLSYRTVAKADSGIYLKGCPQVQIWDFTKEGGKWNLGADKGSGGLWNNRAGSPGKDPLVLADRPFGEWNDVRVVQCGSRTWVWLNAKLVVDGAILENYFDKTRQLPIPPAGPIQLQTHGGEIRWRDVFVRDIPSDEANRLLRGADPSGFKPVFNGRDFTGWAGPTDNYEVVDGAIRCKAGKGGTIFTKDEYRDFVARLEFKLPPGGNNGLAVRYPGQGDTAYVGMCELQVLDDDYEVNKSKLQGKPVKIDARQAHGSAYGMVAAHRGYQRPLGEWNYQEVTVKGSTIKVELNGTVILDCDLSKVTEYMANKAHPGKDRTSGSFGFAGHNDPVAFRNISIQPLN
jgi:hypothetical protein